MSAASLSGRAVGHPGRLPGPPRTLVKSSFLASWRFRSFFYSPYFILLFASYCRFFLEHHNSAFYRESFVLPPSASQKVSIIFKCFQGAGIGGRSLLPNTKCLE